MQTRACQHKIQNQNDRIYFILQKKTPTYQHRKCFKYFYLDAPTNIHIHIKYT